MQTVIITGSCGLVGSEAARFYGRRGYRVVGIDNNMRQQFFGVSTVPQGVALRREFGDNYRYGPEDVRSPSDLDGVFGSYEGSIALVIHAAGQPSHDWAASDPATDFAVNAVGTLNVLEATRRYCPDAPFVFTSTNKVYGDRPNHLPITEGETRYLCDVLVDESMPIDQCLHSVFGASKVAADVMVQEYGRYFKLNTGVFRCGCITGPNHAGAKLHGFLSYLVRCVDAGERYVVIGHKGKQVRDQIHSFDLVTAFEEFRKNPRPGEVYNMGGGPNRAASVLDCIALAEKIVGRKLDYEISDVPRIGDHQWYVSNTAKFQRHYPEWEYVHGLEDMVAQIARGAA